MIIDCIADLHGFQPKLEGGDLLIVAGDLTARDKIQEYIEFNAWLSKQDYTRKIVIAGNHDGLVEKGIMVSITSEKMMLCNPILSSDTIYLQDSYTEFEGLKIYGSPWTPTFGKWHFMKDRGEQIKERWDLIPNDIDILVTHGPPYGCNDYGRDSHSGCEELRLAVERIQPRLHVFGHIHEGYGQGVLRCSTEYVICVNASIMNQYYYPVNKPIRIIL